MQQAKLHCPATPIVTTRNFPPLANFVYSMLAVPFKETSEVEFSTSLGLYLKEHFSDVGDEKVDSAIESLSILRTKSTSISEIANTSDEARDAMLQYMVQLKRMGVKFPVSESQSECNYI